MLRPEDEGKALRIVVFCHVEPGTTQNREIVFHPRHLEGIVATLPRIVEFADTYGLPMTFAMTPTALKANETDLDGHEVGLHLHPQDAQLRKRLGQEITLSSDCLRQYSAEDQSILIDAARHLFEREEGRSPRAFVAGNWSENAATLKLLIEAGFTLDGSPLPRHSSECAEWGRIPRLAQPYAPSPEDYQAAGSLDYLYLPVSQGLWGHYLTPELLHLLGASYFRAALKEAAVGGAEVVHMFFHSPMAMNPLFLSEFREVMDYARDHLGAELALPSSIRPSQGPLPRPFPPAYFARLNWRLAKGFLGRGQFGKRLMGPGSAGTSPSSSTEEESTD